MTSISMSFQVLRNFCTDMYLFICCVVQEPELEVAAADQLVRLVPERDTLRLDLQPHTGWQANLTVSLQSWQSGDSGYGGNINLQADCSILLCSGELLQPLNTTHFPAVAAGLYKAVVRADLGWGVSRTLTLPPVQVFTS